MFPANYQRICLVVLKEGSFKCLLPYGHGRHLEIWIVSILFTFGTCVVVLWSYVHSKKQWSPHVFSHIRAFMSAVLNFEY